MRNAADKFTPSKGGCNHLADLKDPAKALYSASLREVSCFTGIRLTLWFDEDSNLHLCSSRTSKGNSRIWWWTRHCKHLAWILIRACEFVISLWKQQHQAFCNLVKGIDFPWQSEKHKPLWLQHETVCLNSLKVRKGRSDGKHHLGCGTDLAALLDCIWWSNQYGAATKISGNSKWGKYFLLTEWLS